MLPLPIFKHYAPTSIDEAVALMAEHGSAARLIAGGTDLLPNMKHGLEEPDHVVSLERVGELVGIEADDSELVIGAMTRLADVAKHPAVVAHAPALAQACGLVGGPHHRRMGTIGGNVCLDTRCVYYNQTHFWREALGFCLKKDGTACHVVTSGKNCVAAASNDSAPALMALDAKLDLTGPRGSRTLSVNDFYTADGIRNTIKAPDELLTRVRVPIVVGRRSAFEKLRRRGAIDFPLLNVAVRLRLDNGILSDVDLVVSTLAARPKRVKAATKFVGETANDELWAELGRLAHKQCKPLTNLDNDPAWRRAMVRVLVRKAFERAAAS
jgi:4-hydroxybenzoyl-CoA reductase subunit beta